MKKNYQYENSRGTPSDGKYSVYKFLELMSTDGSHTDRLHIWTDGQSNGRDETNIPPELRLRGYNYGRGTCESTLTQILYIVNYSLL